MTKKQKKKTNNMPKINNSRFWCIILIMCLISGVSIILDGLNYKYCWINRDSVLFNSFGIACQVVVSICCAVISMLGIAISLQDKECFGVKLSKLNEMRAEKHFDLKFSIIYTIVLLIIDVVLFLTDQLFVCFGISIIAIVFCIYILYTEIPFMIADEKIVKRIMQDRFIEPLNLNDYNTKWIDHILECQIVEKNIEVVYQELKMDKYPEFNKNILIKLMDAVQNIALNIDYYQSQRNFYNIKKVLIDDIIGILWWHFDIEKIFGADLMTVKHYVLSSYYWLLKTQKSQETAAIKLADIVAYFDKKDNEMGIKGRFTESVILSLIFATVAEGNYVLLKEIKKKFSLTLFLISGDSLHTLNFALISMYLYYLVECEHDYPSNLKQELIKVISSSGIENNTVILSWKELFKNFIGNQSVDYDEFIQIFNENINSMEFMLNSAFWHTCVLTQDFAAEWFLTQILLGDKFYCYDYKECFIKKWNWFLDSINNRCFINDEFVPTENMMRIAKFYGFGSNAFNDFISLEHNKHEFWNYLQELKNESLEEHKKLASEVDASELIEKSLPIIKQQISRQWGYNEEIDVSQEPHKYLAIRCEKLSDAINHNETIVSYFVNGVFATLNYAIESKRSCIEKGEMFEQGIKDLLEENIFYSTPQTEYQTIFIKDEKLQEAYRQYISSVQKVGNRIFKWPSFIKENGFGFNCQIIDYRAKELTGEVLEKTVDTYKRPDGQYVYQGVFMTREDVVDHLKQEFVVLQMEIQYKVDTYDGAIIQIVPEGTKDLFSNN